MSTSAAVRPSVRTTLHSLIDYAGLFPPAQLGLAQAQAEYREARAGAHAWMLGRFIIPARQLIESSGTLAGPFSVIADGELVTLRALAVLRDRGAPIEALEVPLRKNVSFDGIGDDIAELQTYLSEMNLNDIPTYVEVPRSERWVGLVPPAMTALRRAGLRAKLRCGGVTMQSFPTVDEVAEFIARAAEAGVAFKATAGLHHPVRHVEEKTGFPMHGFFNIIAAAALAARVERDTLVRIVAEEEPEAFAFDAASFAWRGERMSLSELARARAHAFVAYGSCSFAEPVDDLVALGLISPR